MQYLVRTSLAACCLLALPSDANAERFSIETHYDTTLDTQCYEGVTATGLIEDSGQMRYGTMNAVLPAPCEVAPGTTPTTNAQHAAVSFFLPAVAPGGYYVYDFSNVELEVYQIDNLVGITATGSFWIAQGLEPGTNWGNAPETGVGSPVIHNMNPFVGGYNLVSFIAPSTQANFGAAAQEAWQQSEDGNFSLRLFAEQPKLPTVEGDGFASLESNELGHPDAFPFTLSLDRTKVACIEEFEEEACDDGNVCNGEETCDGANECVAGTNADAATACPGGECDGEGTCIADNEETPLEMAVPLCAANATNQAICDAVSAYCPCALPGGWGGEVESYSSRVSYFFCGREGYSRAGGTRTNLLRRQMRAAFRPRSAHNNQCWVVP